MRWPVGLPVMCTRRPYWMRLTGCRGRNPSTVIAQVLQRRIHMHDTIHVAHNEGHVRHWVDAALCDSTAYVIWLLSSQECQLSVLWKRSWHVHPAVANTPVGKVVQMHHRPSQWAPHPVSTRTDKSSLRNGSLSSFLAPAKAANQATRQPMGCSPLVSERPVCSLHIALIPRWNLDLAELGRLDNIWECAESLDTRVRLLDAHA